MSTLEAIFLGIIQGLTEFLPVSSSGHLTLVQALLGFENLHSYILFDLICHLGTLLAIFVVFSREIGTMLSQNRTRCWQVILGTLPLFPLVLLLKPIKSLFDQTQYLGFFFLFTAVLLYLGIRYGRSNATHHRWRDPFVIGLFQAVAIVPGISRSGATISGARLMGWQPQEALTFSFLLAIPAILGGMCLEVMQLLFKVESASLPDIGFLSYFFGLATSFGVGWLTLIWLKQLAAKQKFMYFVWYCVAVGLFAIFYFNR